MMAIPEGMADSVLLSNCALCRGRLIIVLPVPVAFILNSVRVPAPFSPAPANYEKRIERGVMTYNQ